VKPEYEKLPALGKSELRTMLRELNPGDATLKIFVEDRATLLVRVVTALVLRRELTAEEADTLCTQAGLNEPIVLGSDVQQDFSVFLRGVPGPHIEVNVSRIGALREEEPGYLKGLMYICGVLFHAEFIRVKWKEVYTVDEDSADGVVKKGDRLATFNEDGVGEQIPWNDQEDSLCQQWWYQSMVHVDECVFHTIEVPPFEGRYVVLIHPGGK